MSAVVIRKIFRVPHHISSLFIELPRRRRTQPPTLSPPPPSQTMASTPAIPRSVSPHPTPADGSSPVSYDPEETGRSVRPRGHYRPGMFDGVGSSLNFAAALGVPLKAIPLIVFKDEGCKLTLQATSNPRRTTHPRRTPQPLRCRVVHVPSLPAAHPSARQSATGKRRSALQIVFAFVRFVGGDGGGCVAQFDFVGECCWL